MSLSQRFSALYRWGYRQMHRIPSLPRNILVTALFLCAAYLASSILITHTGGENNSALVFVLAVVLISLLTTGYFYGILASIVGAFCTNFFFMFPYAAFSLSHTGYPVAMLSMVAISCVVCALTSRVKLQAAEAVRRERKAKALYELNERLNEEKTAIQLQSARETIRGNILRAVSHDLRTPLTSIVGATSSVLENPDLPLQERQELLQDVRDEAQWLIRVVENLLSITRIGDDQAQILKEPQVAEEVLGEAVRKFHKRFPDISVEVHAPEELLIVSMDAILIEQVLSNLLENAVLHGVTTTHICLSVDPDGPFARFSVRDNGQGISAEALPRLFDGTLKGSGTPTGDGKRNMGLGLSVCLAIVRAHSGTMEAKNLKTGAEFSFRLPLSKEEKKHEHSRKNSGG